MVFRFMSIACDCVLMDSACLCSVEAQARVLLKVQVVWLVCALVAGDVG